MLVTLFTDGSWDPDLGRGGWGAYAISERARGYNGGVLMARMQDNTIAELEAIYEGLEMIMRTGIAKLEDTVLIQCDSQAACGLFPNRSPHKDYPMSFKIRKPRSGHEALWWEKYSSFIDGTGLRIIIRWVKGHNGNADTGSSRRHKSNDGCDQLARKGLMMMRQYHNTKVSHPKARIYNPDYVYKRSETREMGPEIQMGVDLTLDVLQSEMLPSDLDGGVHVIIYTDGSSRGNPGKGGWAAILQGFCSNKSLRKMISIAGSEPEATNNQMELRAVIEALRLLDRPSRVLIKSDSKYVVDGATEWLPNWIRNKWKRKVGGRNVPVANIALWKVLNTLFETHFVRFEWVKGHSTNQPNEFVDKLAVEAAVNQIETTRKELFNARNNS